MRRSHRRFLLFGDPATGLKIPLPRMPTGVQAIKQKNNRVRITWNAALDSNGNAVAGYNIYRASAPRQGPYSKINTELVTDTGVYGHRRQRWRVQDRVLVLAARYYAVSSQDD